MDEIKLFISPTYSGPDKAHGGIRRVVDAMVKYLPHFGIRIVDSIAEADVINIHAGSWVEYPHDKPMVSSCHGLYWTDYNWEIGHYGVNLGIIEIMARAQAVTAPSKWVADALSRGMMKKPHVVYHGVDPVLWEPIEVTRQNPHDYVLWNKARADIVSDPADLMRLAQLMPDTKFLTTIGNNTKNVIVSGVLPYPEMVANIKGAGVYLATARETFGIGTIEALASGVPVAGWDFGGQSEIIVNGYNGYLAPYGDYDTLAECVRLCFKEREKLSINARDDVKKRWQWYDKIEKYASIFRAVCEEWYSTRPAVSVIVPCHNLAKYMDYALQSVASQTITDFECIIVDDNSTDGTPAIAQKWTSKDNRFRYLSTPQNLKLSGARNFGFKHSKGRYVLFLDADDMLPPNTLETLSTALNNDQSAHIVYGKLDLLNEDASKHKPGGDLGDFDWRAQMAHHHQFPIGGAMMRRVVMENSGGFRVRDWRAEDAAWIARVTSFGFRAKKVTDKPMLLYRMRGDSKSVKESREHKDVDGDWTAWLSWRLAGSRQAGKKIISENIYPDWRLVPFGAQGRPAKHWNTSHHQNPLVSIIIPVGPGHDAWLIDALDSLLAQNFVSWEVIVINDTGYPIDTSYAPWAKVIDTEGARGAGYARNQGIKAARGELLLFLDADDWLLSNCLNDMVSAYIENGGDKYIYSDYVELRGNGDTRVIHMKPYSQKEWRGQHAVTFLVNKADVIKVGMFDESLPGWEDWDLPIKLGISGFCGEYIPITTFVYRSTTGKRRDIAATAQTELLEFLKERYSRFYEGGRPMTPCCGGGKNKATVEKATKSLIGNSPQRIESAGASLNGSRNVEAIRMVFIGTEKGAITFFRVGGRALHKYYKGAANAANRYINAHPEDVNLLLSTGKWAIVPRPQTVASNVPEVQQAVNLDPRAGMLPAARMTAQDVKPAPVKVDEPEEILITPKAQEIADKHGLNLAVVVGSGTGGKITVKDVRLEVAKLQPA